MCLTSSSSSAGVQRKRPRRLLTSADCTLMSDADTTASQSSLTSDTSGTSHSDAKHLVTVLIKVSTHRNDSRLYWLIIVIINDGLKYFLTWHQRFPFSALTLLVWRQEGHPACNKNCVVLCWWCHFNWRLARLITPVATSTSITLSSNESQNDDIPVPANQLNGHVGHFCDKSVCTLMSLTADRNG